jgi:hypothetical protein
MIITNGTAPVGFRSVKIKMITRSSSESELVALEDASTYGVWYRMLLEDLGVTVESPITITQDNQSAMVMAVQGATFRKTKHLIGKECFVREREPTNEMIADDQANAKDEAGEVVRDDFSEFQRLLVGRN